MSQGKQTVEKDARARAADVLSDGKPIMDKALLLRCAEKIEALKAVLDEIAAEAQRQGGIWAKRRAEQALDELG